MLARRREGSAVMGVSKQEKMREGKGLEDPCKREACRTSMARNSLNKTGEQIAGTGGSRKALFQKVGTVRGRGGGGQSRGRGTGPGGVLESKKETLKTTWNKKKRQVDHELDYKGNKKGSWPSYH